MTHGTPNPLGGLAPTIERIYREVTGGKMSKAIKRRTLWRGLRFRAQGLQSLQTELLSHQLTSSRAIDHLRTIVDFIDSRDNMIVRILNVPLMYSVQVAFAAERWRKAHGHAVRSWLRVIGEIEALLCLSTYSHEHPDDPFPEFVQGASGFDATDLGHPLIPAANCIRNNIQLTDDRQVFLVSGSNMSGKSTLLRAVGINTVLAMAGAPVRAQHLRLTPLHVGASIRVDDSLQEGSSRFYAEITRLRKLLDLASGDPPLLFLLDELLQGTNSNDPPHWCGRAWFVLCLSATPSDCSVRTIWRWLTLAAH